MRAQLQQYVELLFAGAGDCEDIKQEILQNTLDRYDDLIAEGKVPEAAYRLAITGIGDINEILGDAPHAETENHISVSNPVEVKDTPRKKLLRAVAVGLYIICPLPLFVLSELGNATLGLCGLLAIVAVATVLIMLGKNDEPEERSESVPGTPEQELRKSIRSIIRTSALVLFLILSFVTDAWFVTWLIFPISGAVQGLAFAIMDYKEAKEYEA